MPRDVLPVSLYPAFIGPFSQGVRAGDFIFTSGQLPYERVADGIVAGDIQVQTRQAMRNVQEILAAAGATLDDLVKVTLFIRDYQDYSAINDAYSEFFPHTAPARALVQVATLPPGANIIVDAIAYIGKPK
ncbi:MAG TPA: RidA family protein [Anaerolineae bacterium]|nr:RidA family protein [Anaerolineae bacterium]